MLRRIWKGSVIIGVAACVALAAGSCAAAQDGAKAAAAAVKPGAADKAFQAIYKADEKWRRAQRGSVSEEDEKKQLPPFHLRQEDAATQAKALAHWESVLEALKKVDKAKLSAEEQLNLEVYRAQIVVLRNEGKFREYERPVNSDSQFWGFIAPIDAREFRSEEYYTRYLSRLKDVPEYFDEEMANMRAGMARGFTPPRVTLEGRDQGLKDAVNAKGPEETSFWKPFASMPASIPAAEQQRLKSEAEDVIAHSVVPAYAKMLKFFDEEYVPHAVTSLAAEDLPDGKAYYQSKILEYATVTMPPEEIHAIGLKEVASIHAEMLAEMKASGFAGTFPEFLQFLRTDPQFYPKTPEELLHDAAWIAKEFDGVANRYFGYKPRERFGIVPVPPEMAPFFTAGRGGMRTYLLNTYDLPSRSLYALPALTLHESAPGHSWQGAVAMEQEKEKKRPEFRKEYISAYGEGWALYCERLGTEMGMYHTPYEKFGMLSYQAWRAARLVVDTGIHAQGWTREQAQQYLRDNTALSDHEIETEVDRYISWPGQAVSYYLGEMAIVSERKKAEAALGAKFNLRAFHDAVLETGSVPLPVLREHLDKWIAGGGVGPFKDMEQ
ncbi:MAG TPA: DUF885 family protein [Terracidiphilus sp.]|nr:DUF885 family protein [Terracidiphilus sp.]